MLNLLTVAEACRRLEAATECRGLSPFPARALRALAAGLGSRTARCRVMDLAIHGARASASLVALDDAVEAIPGDVFYPGLRVSLSLSRGRVHAAPLFLRLACFNRLTWAEAGFGLRAGPGGRGAARVGEALARVREESARLRARLPEGLARIGALRADGMNETWACALLRLRGLPAGLREPLEQAWRVEGAERSRYGVLNALTRLATHDGTLPIATRRALASVAERIAFGEAARV